MSSMINLKAIKKTPAITVGVNPVTNIHLQNGNVDAVPKVHYPDPAMPNGEFVSVSPCEAAVTTFTTDVITSDDPEKAALMRENAVLKLIIDIQHSNPLIVNKYIIADDEMLVQIVALLCNATEVHIDADDVATGCLSKKTYRKVHSIYVVVNGETKNLKYDFSGVMKTLKDLHISVKYVF